MDFTEECEIGKRIHDDFHALKIGKGYDHCWVIDGFDGTMRETATLRGSESGRTLTVKTTQPGLKDVPMGKTVMSIMTTMPWQSSARDALMHPITPDSRHKD